MSRKIALVALAALVVGGAVAGWLVWAGRIAGDVEVTWSADSPDCAGTTVEKPGSHRPVIDAVESMRCVITVEVRNGSGRTVHLVRAVAPLVGPRTGGVVTAENAEPASPPGDDGIDALFPLDRDLRAGGTSEFDIVLVLNPRGCDRGVTIWSSDWPVVTVEALGRSHDVHGDKDFAFHRDRVTPGCQRFER
ncbi:hypothetical protein [Nocardioides sp.]|uniref:hypothetical protein n=1 Tax=Nocardioides sp. TaxID=35761 RepID=UPI002ED8CFA4